MDDVVKQDGVPWVTVIKTRWPTMGDVINTRWRGCQMIDAPAGTTKSRRRRRNRVIKATCQNKMADL